MMMTQVWKRSNKVVKVPCTVNIYSNGRILSNCKVVERGEVKRSRRLVTNQLIVIFAQSQIGETDVTFDNLKICELPASLSCNAPEICFCPREQCRLNQQNEFAGRSRQARNQTMGNKTRKASDEKCFITRHSIILPFLPT